MPKQSFPSTRRIKEIPPQTQCCQCGKFVQGDPRQTVVKLDRERFLCLKCSVKREQARKALGLDS